MAGRTIGAVGSDVCTGGGAGRSGRAWELGLSHVTRA